MFHLKRNFLLFGSILSISLSASEGGNIRVDLDVLLSCYYFSFSGANERKDVVCLHLQHEKKRLVSFLPLLLVVVVVDVFDFILCCVFLCFLNDRH